MSFFGISSGDPSGDRRLMPFSATRAHTLTRFLRSGQIDVKTNREGFSLPATRILLGERIGLLGQQRSDWGSKLNDVMIDTGPLRAFRILRQIGVKTDGEAFFPQSMGATTRED
nr:unnamed protein product [Haemonchus contortus]